MKNIPLIGSSVVAALSLALTGCQQSTIRVYHTSKELPKAEAPATALGHIPAAWEKAPLGQMRAASFRVKGAAGKTADISVIPLPGEAGRDIDNVNRWRGQVGLSAISESELARAVQSIEIAGQKGQLYEVHGENAGSGDKLRILAAILRKEGTAWFFKISGDDELVAGQKPAFLAYLKTFEFPTTSASPAGTAQPFDLPPNHPPIGQTTQAAQ